MTQLMARTGVHSAQEAERLREVQRLDRSGLEHDPALSLLVSLASSCLEAPMAMVSIVDAEHQRPLVGVGCDLEAIPRDLSFCSQAIAAEGELFVVPDARRDPRFRDNPLVRGAPGLRFYAAAVLTGPHGARLGTLCVADPRHPHHPRERQRQQLRWLADLVVLELQRHEQHHRCPVTGLPTLHQLLRVGRKEWQAATDHSQPLALLLLDCNNFRAVNRCCGHEQGDHFLHDVGEALAEHARPEDFPAHMQADRFALLLPLKEVEQGIALARELQTKLAAMELTSAPPGYVMNPVIGLALTHAADRSFDDLVHRSEQALDLARLQGHGALVELREATPLHAANHTSGRW